MAAPNSNADRNRPIHLGHRDVFLEKAMTLWPDCLKPAATRKRLGQLDAMLYYMQAALEPAALAVKSNQADPQEAALLQFLELILYYLHAARLILESQSRLDDARHPLWKFLRRDNPAAASLDSAKSGEQVLQDGARLFRLLEKPLRDLQQSLLKALSAEDRKRYQRACASLKAHRKTMDHKRHALQARPNFLANS